jgi:hypothetical protein
MAKPSRSLRRRSPPAPDRIPPPAVPRLRFDRLTALRSTACRSSPPTTPRNRTANRRASRPRASVCCPTAALAAAICTPPRVARRQRPASYSRALRPPASASESCSSSHRRKRRSNASSRPPSACACRRTTPSSAPAGCSRATLAHRVSRLCGERGFAARRAAPRALTYAARLRMKYVPVPAALIVRPRSPRRCLRARRRAGSGLVGGRRFRSSARSPTPLPPTATGFACAGRRARRRRPFETRS